MRIGIIGSGVVGQQLAIGFARIGHDVKIGTRDTSKLNEWVSKSGLSSAPSSVSEAVNFGEIIILAVSWSGIRSAIDLAGKDGFKGKVVIDVTNPLDFSQGPPPKLAASQGNSGGEQIQKWLPDSFVVKAFNTISAYIMIDPKREEGDPDLFIAGNNDGAKEKVVSLAENLGWKSIIDMGDISQSFWLETFAMLWIYYGFKHNNWSHAFKLLKK